MNNDKNGLDEMQRARRNRIGNQTFMLMFYALMIDCGLYSFGLRWLYYPANVMVIMMVCMSVYLVRLIAFNAYLPPQAQNKKTVMTLIMASIFSFAAAMAAANLFLQSGTQAVESSEDNSALILLIVAVCGLLISLITAIVKKANNKDNLAD